MDSRNPRRPYSIVRRFYVIPLEGQCTELPGMQGGRLEHDASFMETTQTVTEELLCALLRNI